MPVRAEPVSEALLRMIQYNQEILNWLYWSRKGNSKVTMMRQDNIEKLKNRRQSDPSSKKKLMVKRVQNSRVQKAYKIHDKKRKAYLNAILKAKIKEKKRKAKQRDEDYLDEQAKMEGRKLFKKKKYSEPQSPQQCPVWSCYRVHRKDRPELRRQGVMVSPKSCISNQSRRSRTPLRIRNW